MTRHFDIVVIGAGPAGLAAVRAAAPSGMHIALIDDNPRPGGQVWRQGPRHPAGRALADTLAELAERPNVALFGSARIIAVMSANELVVESAMQGGVRLTYGRLIVAAGARERLLPFAGWTLPGVTGAGGLQALIKGGMPVRGERVVIAGSGPLLIAALASAREAGAHVLAVLEQASLAAVARFGVSLAATPSKLWQAARLTGGFSLMRYWTGSVVREAHGHGRIERVTICRGTRDVMLDCDRLACGYGLVPNVTVAQALGCALVDGAIAVDEAQRTSVHNVFAAGECTGIGGVEMASIEGEIAGRMASGTAVPTALVYERLRWQRFAGRVERAFALGEAARAWPSAETVLCRCEDVAFGAVAAHRNWRDAKLHTRCGMGACQGRMCGAAAQTYWGWSIEGSWPIDTGLRSGAPRPPLSPARISTLMAAASDDDASPIIEAP